MEQWENTVITKIAAVVYVPPGRGAAFHADRPYQGLVINDADVRREYHFSDGKVLITGGYEVFYLPKGTTYHVKTLQKGGCYAINFEADISDMPFALKFRNPESLFRLFKESESCWRKSEPFHQASVIRNVYDIILMMYKEKQKQYVPHSTEQLIAPAIQKIHNAFTDPTLSVASLSALCNISEAYLRRIFLHKFGMTPKDYIIQLRMDYARQLLETSHFTVLETANMCGYTEQCHFSREFTKRVGVPPSAYMKNR